MPEMEHIGEGRKIEGMGAEGKESHGEPSDVAQRAEDVVAHRHLRVQLPGLQGSFQGERGDHATGLEILLADDVQHPPDEVLVVAVEFQLDVQLDAVARCLDGLGQGGDSLVFEVGCEPASGVEVGDFGARDVTDVPIQPGDAHKVGGVQHDTRDARRHLDVKLGDDGRGVCGLSACRP